MFKSNMHCAPIWKKIQKKRKLKAFENLWSATLSAPQWSFYSHQFLYYPYFCKAKLCWWKWKSSPEFYLIHTLQPDSSWVNLPRSNLDPVLLMYWDEWGMRKLIFISSFHCALSECGLAPEMMSKVCWTNETLMIKNSISTHFQQSTPSSRYKKPNQEPSMQAQVSMSINIFYWWVVSLKLKESWEKVKVNLDYSLLNPVPFYIWEIIWIKWLFVQEICLYFGKEHSDLSWCIWLIGRSG